MIWLIVSAANDSVYVNSACAQKGQKQIDSFAFIQKYLFIGYLFLYVTRLISYIILDGGKEVSLEFDGRILSYESCRHILRGSRIIVKEFMENCVTLNIICWTTILGPMKELLCMILPLALRHITYWTNISTYDLLNQHFLNPSKYRSIAQLME